MKKALSFLLVLLLTMAPCSYAVPTAEAAEADIASIVSKAYNSFAAENNVVQASYSGTRQKPSPVLRRRN